MQNRSYSLERIFDNTTMRNNNYSLEKDNINNITIFELSCDTVLPLCLMEMLKHRWQYQKIFWHKCIRSITCFYFSYQIFGYMEVIHQYIDCASKKYKPYDKYGEPILITEEYFIIINFFEFDLDISFMNRL